MKIGIGIDTGGTYTDAVAYDREGRTVLAKGKARTTKEDLSRGICAALDLLPDDLVQKADVVCLSSTLATNASVEGKGGRAKLVLMGTPQKVLARIDAERSYGLPPSDVLCLNTKCSFDGSVVDQPDWDAVIAEHGDWLADAEALCAVEANAVRNGAACERGAEHALSERYRVPFVKGSDLSSDYNMMERGATALLNARLLPVVDDFLRAIAAALEARHIAAPVMIVRSDGSLMREAAAREKPVETILSGPAASVHGGRALAREQNCLIVDMGGTTTDISLVVGGEPVMTGGIRIGNWQTQTRGVLIETFGLGGDSVVRVEKGSLVVGPRRVEPLCAAVERWPQLLDRLRALVASGAHSTLPLYEVLYLARQPRDLARYSEPERELIACLEAGPCMLCERDRLDPYTHDSARLENEGVVMRAGLTPTDIMQLRGDFARYDAEPAELACRYLAARMPKERAAAPQGAADAETGADADAERAAGKDATIARVADGVYNLVERTLYSSIVRLLLRNRYPKAFASGIPACFDELIAAEWERVCEGTEGALFDLGFTTKATLVGIGAPIHLFLPRVAHALGASCIVPEHAEVANAIGAVVADIGLEARIRVRPLHSPGGVLGYTVELADGSQEFEEKKDAVAFATQRASDLARAEAIARGAEREPSVAMEVREQTSHTAEGETIELGVEVIARARGGLFGA